MKSWDDEWLKGKAGAWLASALMAAVAVAALLLCGCSTYTVVPADRQMVPVRATGGGLYVEEPSGACTGWYVPKSTMLDIVNDLNGI